MKCESLKQCHEESNTPSTFFQLCPDCGQQAVEKANGLKLCRNCGEVVF